MTSLMRYHGKEFSQEYVASHVADQYSGRTDYMVAFAQETGFAGSRHISKRDGDSMAALERRVQTRPQIIRMGPEIGGSINYRYPQELNPQRNWGGDYTRTSYNGHFMVLKGFTPEGNPMLMDPANQNLGHVVADRDWFQKYWTDTVDIV